jgi:AraC-like DNA-binding protein
MIKHLPDIDVTYIYEDTDSSSSGSVFWAATKGAGLKRIRDGKIISFTTAVGMTTDVLYQFLEDEQENFWLMSDSGILRVSKSDLNLFASGGADRIHCISFGVSDGLKSLEFDDVRSRNSALKAGNGEFRFITKKGISIVNPAKIFFDKTPPPVIIEAFLFNEQSIPLRLGDLHFQFTAPTLLSPGKIAFKYYLQGRDKAWVNVPAGKERTATYNKLAPGAYIFKATACNAEGKCNPTVTSLSFTLTPFFYQTLLFKIALIFLFVVLAAAVLYIYRKRYLTKKTKYKDSPLQPDFAEECVDKPTGLMEKEKLYCDAGISLQSLAERLSISPHILSQVLNERLKRNFSDFINSYRIEEAKRILESRAGGQRKISVTALDVGFNTMAAFYKAFKKHTGGTPGDFQKKTGDKEEEQIE